MSTTSDTPDLVAFDDVVEDLGLHKDEVSKLARRSHVLFRNSAEGRAAIRREDLEHMRERKHLLRIGGSEDSWMQF